MPKIRVMVVDDAVVVRRMVSDVLASDPDLEVAATAPNGRIALAKIPQVNPDLITMDVEMPEMNGLETLKELRKTHPMLPVIMFSTQTQRGASATLDALSLGATDYVTKPANVGSVAEGMQRLREQLIPKIRLYCKSKIQASASISIRPSATPKGEAGGMRMASAGNSMVELLAVGVSTGGPNALAELLPQLPGDLPVPVVIVQHMPPVFTQLLANRLDAQCAIRVHEGMAGGKLTPGHAWIAPGDFHMSILNATTSKMLTLHQGPPENSCRPAVDVLFRSAVESYGSGVLGVILTGMGRDGLRGCERIHEAGGQILAQDEASSVVWGMPGFVARAGLAEKVLPLKEMAQEIVRRVQRGRSRNSVHVVPSRPGSEKLRSESCR
ncbi:MAG: chemotaxis response regulator protein-glutamate methylesterase [Gemmataceae bacterium]|nr:chemotaxis response regulator protein-glutamate methylesterase [Gemmataceae bacterium]